MSIPELTTAELVATLEAADEATAPQVLDVRAPERAGRDAIEAPRYFNVPGSRVLPLADAAVLGLDRARPVVVVCDRGMSSRPVAQHLLRQGFDARSLAHGMLGWRLATVRRPVHGLEGLDRLVQIDRIGKGALGYFAERRGEALVVDPGRDLAPYEELLRESGARLVAVIDTHCHADYLSGGPALAAAHRVPYLLHPADAVDPYAGRPARIDFTPLRGGDTVAIGDARFTVEHLPGHTEGSLVLRLGEELALTGDLLFVASVGRPDLGGQTASWTAALWQSLESVRQRFGGDLRLFPAHYGSTGERAPTRVVEARMADLAACNPPFAIADASEFSAWISARAGEFPAEYRTIKLANLGLVDLPADLADELEAGKNRCALST